MLGIKRPDALFEQQVQAHAHAGQRRFQFVANRRDQVCLHLVVQQAQAGNILKHDRRAKNDARFIAHANDSRQNEEFLLIDAKDDYAIKAGWQVIRRALDHPLHLLLHAQRQAVFQTQLE